MSFSDKTDLQTPKKDVNQLFQDMGAKLGWFQYKDLDTAAKSLSLSSKKKTTSSKAKRSPKNRSTQGNSCSESDTNFSGFEPKTYDATCNGKERLATHSSSVTKPKSKKGSVTKSTKKVKKKLHLAMLTAEFSSDDDSFGIPARASKACTDLTRETSIDTNAVSAGNNDSSNFHRQPSYGHAGSESSPDSVNSDHEIRYCESTRIFSRKSAIFEGLLDLSPVEDSNDIERSFSYPDPTNKTTNTGKCSKDIEDDNDVSLLMNAMQLSNVSVRKRRTVPKSYVNETADEFYTVCEGNSSSGSNDCYKTVLDELQGLTSKVVSNENDDLSFVANTPPLKTVSNSYISENSSFEVVDVSVQTDQNLFDSDVFCNDPEHQKQTDSPRKKWSKLSLKSRTKPKTGMSEVSKNRSQENSLFVESNEEMSEDSASSFEVQDVSIQTVDIGHHEVSGIYSSKSSSVESLPELPGAVDDILKRLHNIGDIHDNQYNSGGNDETVDYEVQYDSIKHISTSSRDDINEFSSAENNQLISDRRISDAFGDKTVYYETNSRLSVFNAFRNTKESSTNGDYFDAGIQSIEESFLEMNMKDNSYVRLSNDECASDDSLPEIISNKYEDIKETMSVESLPDILDRETAHAKSRLTYDPKITLSVESLPDIDIPDISTNILHKKIIIDKEYSDSVESLPDLNQFKKPGPFQSEHKFTVSDLSDSAESLPDIKYNTADHPSMELLPQISGVKHTSPADKFHHIGFQKTETKSWRTPLRSRPPFIDSSDDDDDDMEAFYERMRTPAKREPSLSPDMKAFIVDSDSSCDSDDNVFYANADRIITPASSVRKPSGSRVVQPASSDEEPENLFKTPKTLGPNQKKEPKPLTNHNLFSSSKVDQPMTFLKSLCSTVSDSSRTRESSRCVLQFKKHREGLAKKLFLLFNDTVFEDKLPHNLPVIWINRLVKTAGYCKYKRNKSAASERSAIIELSTKVCDSAERTRDTLIHELCHAAVWLLNGLKEGHGPYWKYWVRKANVRHPELPIISRCHTYSISTKYTYQCLQCGYKVGRHSKSLNTVKKVCGYCRGTFVLQENASANGSKTPRTPNKFALFVKENYSSVKSRDASLKHAGVMNILSSEFAKTKISNS